jgi:hypothetical protein
MSPFAEWTRGEPRLESTREGLASADIDWIWHRFKINGERGKEHIMLIEDKSHWADVSPSQRDTLIKVHQMIPHRRAIPVLNNRGQTVLVRFWGYFKLRYDGDPFERSTRIEWNNKPISIKQLVGILRFEIDPVTLVRMDPRFHHHHPEKTPAMF